jgi:hypothetical protein
MADVNFPWPPAPIIMPLPALEPIIPVLCPALPAPAPVPPIMPVLFEPLERAMAIAPIPSDSAKTERISASGPATSSERVRRSSAAS